MHESYGRLTACDCPVGDTTAAASSISIYIYIRTVLISILPVTAPLVVQQQQPEACLYRIDHY